MNSGLPTRDLDEDDGAISASKDDESKPVSETRDKASDTDFFYFVERFVRLFRLWSIPMSVTTDKIENEDDAMSIRIAAVFAIAWLAVLIKPVADNVTATSLSVFLTGLLVGAVGLADRILKIKIGHSLLVNLYAFVLFSLIVSGFIFYNADSLGIDARLIGDLGEAAACSIVGVVTALIVVSLKSLYVERRISLSAWFKDVAILVPITFILLVIFLLGLLGQVAHLIVT